jgi:hypothetical protein
MWKVCGEQKRVEGFVGKCQVRSKHGRPGHEWENNIKKDLEENG